jgi:hypothetical protein
MTSRASLNPSPAAERSPEAELLLCCARTSLDAQHLERARTLLGGVIQWDELLRMAWLHRVLPLLYWHLWQIGRDTVPEPVLDKLRTVFSRNAGRNLRLMREVHEILGLLAANHISAIPYKGPVLAQQIYGNLALREIGDLDIMVRKEDFAGAQALLRRRGYQPQEQLTAAQERIMLRSDCNQVLVHQQTGEILELHWAITGPRFTSPVDLDELWVRVEHKTVGRTRVLALSPEDLLLVLCYHGSRHMWERLEWITGVAELVRTGDLDWDLTVRTAERHGSRRMLLLGLTLAHELLDARVPQEILRLAEADPGLAAPATWVREHLFSGEDAWSHSFGMQFHRFQLSVKERLRDRIRYGCHAIISPAKEDWRAVPLSGALSPLYSLIRPVRLLASYSSRGLRS